MGRKPFLLFLTSLDALQEGIMFSGFIYLLFRFQPAVGLMERIQAIAQNVSDIAIKVDQILRNSLMNGKGKSALWFLTLHLSYTLDIPIRRATF